MNPRLRPTALPPIPEDLGTPTSVAEVLAGARQRLRPAAAPGLRVRRGYTWEHTDRHDTTWWPQGITTSVDAGRSGEPGMADLLLVSWYSNGGEGVRISFVDRRARRYGHVPVAIPGAEGRLTPLKIHAGGIVWRGPWLYLASTARGCYVAHLEDLRRRPSGELVWPVRMLYAAPTDRPDHMRYSFISLTEAARGAGPELLAGEYGGPRDSQRLARFALEPSGLLRLDGDGLATAVGVDVGVPSMQGAARAGERYLLMVSRGRRRPGDLWTGPAHRLRRRSFAAPPGPEDVSWDGRLLWSVTEFPGRRWIFALKPPRR